MIRPYNLYNRFSLSLSLSRRRIKMTKSRSSDRLLEKGEREKRNGTFFDRNEDGRGGWEIRGIGGGQVNAGGIKGNVLLHPRAPIGFAN